MYFHNSSHFHQQIKHKGNGIIEVDDEFLDSLLRR
jgi:hypothetical protein